MEATKTLSSYFNNVAEIGQLYSRVSAGKLKMQTILVTLFLQMEPSKGSS